MPKPAKAKPAVKQFDATLERMRSRLNWVIVTLPFDAAKAWGSRGQIRVKGEINGFPFRTSLFPTGEGRHYLLVNKAMQKGAKARPGNVAHIRMEADLDQRKPATAPELLVLLNQDRSLRGWYESLNASTRNYIAQWVSEPKSADARRRRAEQIAERCMNVMDAEKELPPVLRLAFARNPQAREGWDAMSVARRRGHLFGVFYYRTPEAQANRIGKMLDDAVAVADRRQGRKG